MIYLFLKIQLISFVKDNDFQRNLKIKKKMIFNFSKIINIININTFKINNNDNICSNKFRNISRLLIIIVLIDFIKTQNSTLTSISANKNNLVYDGILGIGWGVFAIICSMIIGVLICIYGFSTIYSLAFYFTGFAIPIITFLVMIFSPLEVDGEEDISENQTKNNFIVARWFFFTLTSVGLITLLIPFLKLWTMVLVPQRVDSRTQKEYYEKIEQMYLNNNNNNDGDGSGDLNNNDGQIKESDKRISIFYEPEVLPLNNQFVPQNQQQDIEMANVENLANRERKRKIKGLKRKNIEEI